MMRYLKSGKRTLLDCKISKCLTAFVILLIASHTVYGQNVTYYINDHLGSPVAAVDANREILWIEKYNPYGSRIIQSEASTNNNLWYTGKEQDKRTGLSYYNARYYDPLIGRFMSVDPVGFSEDNLHSFNKYSYANNNPYKYIDPTGEIVETAWDAASISIGVASLMDNVDRGAWWSASVDVLGIVLDGIAAAAPGVPGGVGIALSTFRKTGTQLAEEVQKKGGTETVQRWMSQDELKATQETGLLRGGSEGTHYVTDAANSSARRARQRLALPQTPEVKVTFKVPKDAFSKPSKVVPAFNMPGGGMERTATGNIPVIIERVQ